MLNDELLDLEHGFWNAAGDGRFYVEHMHHDGLCLLPVGTMDKAATIDAIGGAEPWSEHEFTDVAVHRPGTNVAVLTYRATGMRSTSNQRYEALVSTTYVRVDDSWKLLLHQQTPLMT